MAKLLTTPELAAVLRITPRTVEAMRSRGDGPPFSRVGAQVRYDADAVDLWLKRNTMPSYDRHNPLYIEGTPTPLTGTTTTFAPIEQPPVVPRTAPRHLPTHKPGNDGPQK